MSQIQEESPKTRVSARKVITEYSLITLGTLLLAAGVYFFKFPNNFTTGGVSGISLLLGGIIPVVTPSTMVLILNVLLLILGFIFVGNSFGIKTVYSSLLFSGAMVLLEKFVPMTAPLTDQPFLELLYAMLLSALGSSLVFNMGASTGGTDITAMILRKYTDLDIGKALLVTDGVITAAAFFVFDIKTGMFSLMGLIIKTTAVDVFIENLTLCKYFTIVTTQSEAVAGFIMNELHHGVTIADAQGGFTHEDKKLIMVACKRSEALVLKRRVKKLDPHAFMFITNTSEIIGKGFRQ
ncbi:MAG: YitT family protein [Clostridia bacterium]|nr:YitT family protein [Clostridia bacterium]